MAAAASYGRRVDEDIVEYFNERFGDDLKKLPKAKEMYGEVKQLREELEKRLCLASSEVPSELDVAISNAESVQSKVRLICSEQKSLQHRITEHVRAMHPLARELSRISEQVGELEKYSKYFTCIAKIQELSSAVQVTLLTDSIQKSVDAFQEMTDLYLALQTSSCTNLLKFAKETILFWHNIMKKKIAGEFEDRLKMLNWPRVTTSLMSPPAPNLSEVKNEMASLFKQLLSINLPDVLHPQRQVTSSHLSNFCFRPLVLPLQLMLLPLKKRFKYHFYGNKQTNSLEKPEWYFTQILSWIRDHTDFLESTVQPLLDESEEKLDSKVELMRGLVLLVMEKMVSDLSEVLYDELLFTHLIDETLSFDRELRTSYGYPAGQPGALHVLCEQEVFEKWLVVEKKYAVEKVDAMMSSPTAWQSQYCDITDVDELKVPESGESFMTLMLTITDRYKQLPYPPHKLRFLDLQLELLEDFRIRLVQVMKQETSNPLGQCYCSILNTAYYVAEVLQEWSELVFFVQLQYYRHKESRQQPSKESVSLMESSFSSCVESAAELEVSPSSSLMLDSVQSLDAILEANQMSLETVVFDDVIELFNKIKEDMLKNILTYVFTDVKARSLPYRKDKWIMQSCAKDSSMGLSITACEMFLVLKAHMQTVEQLISKPLFVHFWQRLAEKLNKFIIEDVMLMVLMTLDHVTYMVILPNYFNEGGAMQLNFDMTRNLFPLFGEYTQKPNNYFRDVKEACILLNIKMGSALLLRDVFNTSLRRISKDQNKEQAESKAALHDVGVLKLSAEQAKKILDLRTDLSSL